jgi:hypothetical protein
MEGFKPGDNIGKPAGWTPESDLDHFMVCPGCGAVIDMRDLGMALQHAGELPRGPGVPKS